MAQLIWGHCSHSPRPSSPERRGHAQTRGGGRALCRAQLRTMGKVPADSVGGIARGKRDKIAGESARVGWGRTKIQKQWSRSEVI